MPRKTDLKDYTHYVLVFRDGKPIIESGWSFREDAVEHVRELHESAKKLKTKIVAKRNMPVTPFFDENWLKGPFYAPEGGPLEGPESYDPSYLLGIQKRVAKALGWSLQDVQSMSLASLREQVRPVSPKLAHELTEAIRSMGA